MSAPDEYLQRRADELLEEAKEGNRLGQQMEKGMMAIAHNVLLAIEAFNDLRAAFTDDDARCKCGCSHFPCKTFESGGNGRCVYCDHGEQCHPGEGDDHNRPL